MPQTFDCPKCGAPVDYVANTFGNDYVRCSYCNSTLAQPNAALGRPAQVIRVDLRDATKHLKPLRWLWVLVLVPVLGVVALAVATFVGLLPVFLTSSNGNRSSGTTGTTSGQRDQRVLLKFGSEGIGPGMFKDARSIAVDASGNIYVGEYLGGRVQVFDSNGKFITQWTVDPNMPLRGFASDRKGNVYIAQKGQIVRYEGSTGKRLGEFEYKEGNGFDDITATPDGGLVCAWYRNRDDVVRFNSSGEVVSTIKEAISSASGKSELDMSVAVDGLGNTYALGSFNDAVFKFGPDGKFITRFGGSGSEPGQLRAASAIAVDGRGRVYVSDVKGIQVFDPDGRYLSVVELRGTHGFGMVFNDKNELFVAARTQVIKLNFGD